MKDKVNKIHEIMFKVLGAFSVEDILLYLQVETDDLMYDLTKDIENEASFMKICAESDEKAHCKLVISNMKKMIKEHEKIDGHLEDIIELRAKIKKMESQ